MKSKTCKAVIALLAAAVFLIAGAGQSTVLKTGEMKTEKQSVEVGQAKSADISLSLETGSLKLHGGAANLMDAVFTYNVPEWKPAVSYEVKDGVGKLSVTEPKTDGRVKGKAKNEWDIGLKNGFPLDLEVNLTTGSGEIDLGGLCLSSFELNQVTGNANVRLCDHPNVANLDLNCVTGSIDADMSGKWQHNMQGSISVVTGGVSIRLPRDIGVRVSVSKVTGNVDTGGLIKQNGYYINEAYGKSDVTLSLDASVVTGNITLIQSK
ncbi:MAG: toast rack family protein [Armatimonadota bacterium]